MKKPDEHRLVILILVLVFVASSLVYRIMGYGETVESIHQGIGFPCYDLTLNDEIVQSIINGKFDVYEKQWNGVQLSATGGFVYPPLTGYLIAPGYLIADKLGFSKNEIVFDLSPIPFIFLSGAAVFLVVLLAERRPSGCKPQDSILLATILLFGGLLFHEGAVNGKFEGVMVFFLLLGMLAASRGPALSAICFALAVCTKQTAVIILLPTFIVLAANAVRDRQFKYLGVWLSCFGVTVLIVFLPFMLSSGIYDIYRGLIKTFSLHEVMYQTPVWYFCRLIALFTGSERALLSFAAAHSNSLSLLICAGISMVAVKRRFDVGSEQYFALVTITSFFYIILGKYYLVGIYDVLPTMLFTLWCLRTSRVQPAFMFLLWQSFVIMYMPILYKREALYITYTIVCFYVYFVSLRNNSNNHGTAPLVPEEDPPTLASANLE